MSTHVHTPLKRNVASSHMQMRLCVSLCVLPLQESSRWQTGTMFSVLPLPHSQQKYHCLLPCCQSADRTLLHVDSYQSPETSRGEEVGEEEEKRRAKERERDKCLVTIILFHFPRRFVFTWPVNSLSMVGRNGETEWEFTSQSIILSLHPSLPSHTCPYIFKHPKCLAVSQGLSWLIQACSQ